MSKKQKEEKEKKCNCGHEGCSCDHTHECDCGDDCHCHDDECDCGCEHEFESRAEEFKAYREAFEQFEKALEKVDHELTLEREKSARAEHLADTYKKDLDRYKERNKDIEKESKAQASISVASKILPILDNFEQALRSVKDENVMVGFRMIQTGIKNILRDMDVVEMENLVNAEFDPSFHEAVNRIPTDDKNLDGKIANVYKIGYYLASDNSKVIRHAQVEIYKN